MSARMHKNDTQTAIILKQVMFLKNQKIKNIEMPQEIDMVPKSIQRNTIKIYGE